MKSLINTNVHNVSDTVLISNVMMKLAGNSFCPSPNYKRATWVTIPVWYATSTGQTGGGSRSKVLVVLKHCSPHSLRDAC